MHRMRTLIRLHLCIFWSVFIVSIKKLGICSYQKYTWWSSGLTKLTTSLVNDLLKFTSSDAQICWNFLLKKMWVKATHIFSAKDIRILCIESAKTVNEITLNEHVKLTMLWTTGPWSDWMCKLIWVFAGHTWLKVHYLMLQLMWCSPRFE